MSELGRHNLSQLKKVRKKLRQIWKIEHQSSIEGHKLDSDQLAKVRNKSDLLKKEQHFINILEKAGIDVPARPVNPTASNSSETVTERDRDSAIVKKGQVDKLSVIITVDPNDIDAPRSSIMPSLDSKTFSASSMTSPMSQTLKSTTSTTSVSSPSQSSHQGGKRPHTPLSPPRTLSTSEPMIPVSSTNTVPNIPISPSTPYYSQRRIDTTAAPSTDSEADVSTPQHNVSVQVKNQAAKTTTKRQSSIFNYAAPPPPSPGTLAAQFSILQANAQPFPSSPLNHERLMEVEAAEEEIKLRKLMSHIYPHYPSPQVIMNNSNRGSDAVSPALSPYVSPLASPYHSPLLSSRLIQSSMSSQSMVPRYFIFDHHSNVALNVRRLFGIKRGMRGEDSRAYIRPNRFVNFIKRNYCQLGTKYVLVNIYGAETDLEGLDISSLGPNSNVYPDTAHVSANVNSCIRLSLHISSLIASQLLHKSDTVVLMGGDCDGDTYFKLIIVDLLTKVGCHVVLWSWRHALPTRGFISAMARCSRASSQGSLSIRFFDDQVARDFRTLYPKITPPLNDGDQYLENDTERNLLGINLQDKINEFLDSHENKADQNTQLASNLTDDENIDELEDKEEYGMFVTRYTYTGRHPSLTRHFTPQTLPVQDCLILLRLPNTDCGDQSFFDICRAGLESLRLVYAIQFYFPNEHEELKQFEGDEIIAVFRPATHAYFGDFSPNIPAEDVIGMFHLIHQWAAPRNLFVCPLQHRQAVGDYILEAGGSKNIFSALQLESAINRVCPVFPEVPNQDQYILPNVETSRQKRVEHPHESVAQQQLQEEQHLPDEDKKQPAESQAPTRSCYVPPAKSSSKRTLATQDTSASSKSAALQEKYKRTLVEALQSKPCTYGFACHKQLTCPLAHTEEQQELWTNFAFRTIACLEPECPQASIDALSNTPERNSNKISKTGFVCPNFHSQEQARCLKCLNRLLQGKDKSVIRLEQCIGHSQGYCPLEPNPSVSPVPPGFNSSNNSPRDSKIQYDHHRAQSHRTGTDDRQNPPRPYQQTQHYLKGVMTATTNNNNRSAGTNASSGMFVKPNRQHKSNTRQKLPSTSAVNLLNEGSPSALDQPWAAGDDSIHDIQY